MQREAFVFENGQTFTAWNVQFGGFKQEREVRPCKYLEVDGSFREGTLRCVVESAEVKFCALPGTITVGQQGQLSCEDDRFYDVTVSFVEPAHDHVLVCGEATRKFDCETDR
jgi:hypothetical protein